MSSKTVTEHIRDHLENKILGLHLTKNLPDLDSMYKTERSPFFESIVKKIKFAHLPLNLVTYTKTDEFYEHLMRRKIMGAFRYGLFNVPGKTEWDRIPSIEKRLMFYQETKNAEHLIDIANICELEFAEGHNEFQDLGRPSPSMRVFPIKMKELQTYLDLYKAYKNSLFLALIWVLCEIEYTYGDNRGCIPIDDGHHAQVKK